MKIPSKSWNMIDGALVFKTPKHFRDTQADDARYEKDLAEFYKTPTKFSIKQREHEKARRHTCGNRRSDHKSMHYMFQSIPRRLSLPDLTIDDDVCAMCYTGSDNAIKEKVVPPHHECRKTTQNRSARRDSHESSRQRCFVAKTRFTQNLRRIVLEDIEYDYFYITFEERHGMPSEAEHRMFDLMESINILDELEEKYEEEIADKGWSQDHVIINTTLELEECYEEYILSGLQQFADKYGKLPEGCNVRGWATVDLSLNVQMIQRCCDDPQVRNEDYRDHDLFDDYDGCDSEASLPNHYRTTVTYAPMPPLAVLEQEFVRGGAKKVRA